MQKITIHADRPRERHAALLKIGRRWGLETRLVLQEFLANAAEHCRDHRVEVTFYPRGLVALDHGGGVRTLETGKPRGEGGHGMTLISAFGGAVSRWAKGMRLDFKFPQAG